MSYSTFIQWKEEGGKTFILRYTPFLEEDFLEEGSVDGGVTFPSSRLVSFEQAWSVLNRSTSDEAYQVTVGEKESKVCGE